MVPDEYEQYERYQRILAELRLEEPPTFYETGSLPQERYPDLHERQIEENNRAWAHEREERVEGHGERVRKQLCHCSAGKRPGEATNGKKQKVWCVELRQCFESLSEAARLAGRAPSNVLQSIRFGVRCGAFHWERYDPTRHHPDPQTEPAADAIVFGRPASSQAGAPAPDANT